MRRIAALLTLTAALVAGAPAAAAVAAPPTTPPSTAPAGDAASRGLVLAGLKASGPGSPCQGAYELVKSGRCTHGPDPAPPGVDVHARQAAGTAADTTSGSGTAAATASVPCYGDGTTGDRVQAIYAHAADVSDAYGSTVSSIRQWAAEADDVYNQSAAETGGVRHIRFVTDASCNLSVLDVQVTATGDDSIDNTIKDLESLGYTRADRKYLVWMDANVYCGIAQVYDDDSAGTANLSNGNLNIPGEVARVDNSCWGKSSINQSVEAHELMHTLGGVQTSAPHATKYNHCWDESDRMCYVDGSGSAMQQVCPTTHENRFDCNHDDYFSTNPPAGGYLATHWNTANSSFLATTNPTPPPAPTPPPPTPTAAASGRFTPLAPSRILDTRNGTGGYWAKVGAGQHIDVQVAGVGGVPSTGAAAVALNVTATEPTSGSYLTVYPAGTTRPNASNLNFDANQTVPNMVVAKIGANGKVSVYNDQGATHVIFDVAGWYTDGTGTQPAGGLFTPLPPARVLDTRNGVGGISSPVGNAQSAAVQVTGVGGVPSAGVAAVVLNVTVTQPTAGSYLTVFPTGTSVPNASNLNFGANQTVPNLVVAKVGSGGRVSVYNAVGSTHVIFDVAGWYSDGTTQVTGGLFGPLAPARILDTRNGTGGISQKVGPNQAVALQVAGQGGVPGTGVSAVILNVTVTDPTAGSYLTVYPNGAATPNASNLNFGPNQTVPNLVVAKVGSNGKVAVYNNQGATDVIVDVAGWYST